MKKYTIMLLGITFITSLSMSVFAESITDQTNDIYHWNNTGTKWSWETNVGGKPNIDITELSYSSNGEQVTLILMVTGSITNSELVSYWAYLNTSDSNYMFSYNNGEGFGFGSNKDPNSFEMDYDPDISANGNKITAVFDIIGTFQSGIELWGWAAEYTTYGDTSAEWWADWAPEEYAWYEGDQDNGDEGTDSSDSNDDTESTDPGESNINEDNQNTDTPQPSGTPGFEIFTLIAALAGIMIVIKRRN